MLFLVQFFVVMCRSCNCLCLCLLKSFLPFCFPIFNVLIHFRSPSCWKKVKTGKKGERKSLFACQSLISTTIDLRCGSPRRFNFRVYCTLYQISLKFLYGILSRLLIMILMSCLIGSSRIHFGLLFSNSLLFLSLSYVPNRSHYSSVH